MPIHRTSQLLEYLRRTALPREGAALTDGQLLENFVVRSDSDAFEALMRRHGPLVLGVCRRVLKNSHDAEDAFQAAFLVLVRKARSLRFRRTVGDWLYGVAHKTALKARAVALRRKDKEKQVQLRTADEPNNDLARQELLARLDQEISQLPTNYRVPILLCDLEGKTRKEAAQMLGWPEGTVAGRLARARDLLAHRMSSHGLTLTRATLAMALAEHTVSAAVPSTLITVTLEAATLMATGQVVAKRVISANVAALTEGVMHTMWMTKLKLAMNALLICGLITVGSQGLVTAQRSAEQEKKEGDGKLQSPPEKREVGGEIEQAKAAFDRAKADYEKALRNRALREIEEAVAELKSNPPPNKQKELELLLKIKNAVEGIMPPPVDTGRPGPGPGGPRNP